MKKTKIVCTMGPNTSDRNLLRDMILAGMDVARFNFSHGDHEEHEKRIETLKELRDELDPVSYTHLWSRLFSVFSFRMTPPFPLCRICS